MRIGGEWIGRAGIRGEGVGGGGNRGDKRLEEGLCSARQTRTVASRNLQALGMCQITSNPVVIGRYRMIGFRSSSSVDESLSFQASYIDLIVNAVLQGATRTAPNSPARLNFGCERMRLSSG